MYIYYLEQMGAWVMKNWKLLLLISLKFASLVFVIYKSFDLSIFFLTDEIVSCDMKEEDYLELIKMLYSEDPLKLVLPFSIFAMVMSLWSVFWRVIDKNIEFKNAEFAQNELRYSNAVNLLSKKEDPIFPSEGIRELARLKRNNKIDSKRVDQLTSSGIKIERGQFASADLIGIDLSNADLWNSNFKNADMKDAHLENALLSEADLENVNLDRTNLNDSNLTNAILKNAKLKNTKLKKAILQKADLENANLDDTNLDSAVLMGANLSNATLKNANLKNANLRFMHPDSSSDLNVPDFIITNLKKSNLENADLEDADFTKANLENANLENAILKNAKFRIANLRNANLEHANLENADFTGANLENAKLENTNHEKADFTGANKKGTILENK